jgi:CheY-like chemotaxis protein
MKPARLPIVVIEDDDLDAEQTTDALRRGGVTRTIIRLNDGAEAIDYFATLSDARASAPPPAFVLLDLKMPKFDGLDVLRFRSEQPALRLFPVIVFTSSAYELDIERSAQLGANAYVVKPVDPRAYEATVAATGKFWSEYDRLTR